jgi:osmotically-inducible protein OsmY
MSDDDLERSVTDELFCDPKVDSAAIPGVTSVDNEQQVRILDEHSRDDAELRGAVLQALMRDSLVPSTIDAKVDDGSVTLTGSANWQFQRDEAELIAANILGVGAVENEIDLVAPGPSADDIEHSIKNAMERNAILDAEGVAVESSNGTVTLRGTVSSWADHDEAVAAAWAAPGVTRVKDDILVAY